MGFSHIGQLLPQATKRAAIAPQVNAARVLDGFFDLLIKRWGSEVIGRRCKPVSVRHNTLTLMCVSAPLAQEIKFKELELLAELNERFGKVVVEKIRYLG